MDGRRWRDGGFGSGKQPSEGRAGKSFRCQERGPPGAQAGTEPCIKQNSLGGTQAAVVPRDLKQGSSHLPRQGHFTTW